jgi:hypothetical protein
MTCFFLILRGYLRTHAPLLLWCALCFAGLSLNNLVVVIDLIIFPGPAIDLRPLRTVFHVGALALLIYGLVLEADL